MRYLSLLLLLSNAFVCTFAFAPPRWVLRNTGALLALEPSEVQKLNDIRYKYKRLSNLATPEAEQEASQLNDIATKFTTYLEVSKLMIKFRSMYKNESSSQRKAKQLRSFVNLYENKLELEQILREKLGLPKIPDGKLKDNSLAELERINKHIAQLESTLEDVQMRIPEGKSTRQQRSM